MKRCARTILTLLVLSVVASAESNESTESASAPSSALNPSGLRPVRVLVADQVRQIRVRSDKPLYLLNEDGVRVGAIKRNKWQRIEYRAPDRIVIGDRNRPSGFQLETDEGGVISVSQKRDRSWTDVRRYPGILELRVGDGALSVINLVDIERYVACVVGYEVWPTFQTEAYRAQAIVARTYALYEMKQRQRRDYDVRATQNSQVYRGLREDVVGRRATEAALFTRGYVLTAAYEGGDEMFCTYYSAACGGVSQAATVFGSKGAITPLAGGVRCNYCSIAPGDTFRWGPVRLKLTEVRKRLVKRYPDLRALGGLRRIEVADTSKSGRLLNLRLSGADGKTELILAERFRLAVGAGELKSTDFKIECDDRYVTFKDGRGFGHGLGLCQWGAEGQARQGRRAEEILRFYFPGAKLARAYD